MVLRHIVTVFFFSCLLFSCSDTPKESFSILAGSELKDIKPLLNDIQKCANATLEFQYIGTLDGAEKLAGGELYDIAWFSHAKYLTLLEQTRNRIVSQDKIMLSPVVMGIKESQARKFGWDTNKNLTWRDIANKAATGQLRYAMTNPASSNSGFTALVGVAAAFSNSQDTFDLSSIDEKTLKQFFKGQDLTAGSSGWLAESYVREQDRLDAIINYESVLMQLNASGNLKEKLILVYPQEGIITADYPLMLLNNNKKKTFHKLVECLMSEKLQNQIMKTTQRRPVNPKVKPDARFPKQLLVELPFPRTLSEIDKLLFAYLDKHRKPSHTFFVLDISGSMQGSNINLLKQSISNLTGADQSITGQFSRFRARETITIIPFNSKAFNPVDFKIQNTDYNSTDMQSLRNHVQHLQALGGTAIYSALDTAYKMAIKAQNENPEKFYSILLLTDGSNQSGINFQTFKKIFRRLPQEAQRIKTFPILFGDSNDVEMNELSNITGGRIFDAKKQSLHFVFKKIRGYQ